MSSSPIDVGDDGAMASISNHHGVRLRLQGIGKHYGDSRVLDGVDLDIASGELVALLGPSGSGKTTLLRVVAGLLHADDGRVLFDDGDATDLSLRERNVGFVFQHYALFKHMTVAQNVAFGLSSRPRRTRPARKVIAARVAELLGLVQLPDLGGRYPEQLSGGQKQRVALARALAVDPNVLLLDEPFGALDAKVRVELRRWLRGLHEQTGQTTLFVTHDQDEALELADRVVLLRDGRIEQVGTPAQLYDTPASAYVFGFIGRAAVLDGVVLAGRFEVPGTGWSVDAAGSTEGPAQLYVRPHDVLPDAAGGERLPGSNGSNGSNEMGLAAQVLAVHRLADRVTVHVQVAGQPRIFELDVPAGDAGALPVVGSVMTLALRSVRIYPT